MARERRIKGEGSIYQRADGRWTYTIDLGWQGGRRRRRSVTAPTRKALQPKINKLRADLAAGLSKDGSMAVETWLTYWLDEIAVDTVRPRTLAGYRGYVSTWIIPRLGKHRLDSLDAADVRSLYRHMQAEGKSTATIRQCHAILRRALEVALNEGKIARNPASTVTPPKPTERGSHGKLTTAEAQKVLRHLADDGRQARWCVALLAGLRQGEALGLAWADVDMERRRIIVRSAQQRIDGALTITGVKSASSRRSVPMLPEVHLALERHRLRHPDDELVFGPRDNKADWKEWRAILDECGLAPRPVHACRATTASLLSDARVPSKIIAEILGHSSPRITEDAYIHGDDTSHRQAMEAMDGLLAIDPA